MRSAPGHGFISFSPSSAERPSASMKQNESTRVRPASIFMFMATILIFGASGQVSSAAIRALQGQGHRLIGVVRDLAKEKPLEQPGVEPKSGALDKPRSVEAAFEGIDVAFILPPPGPLAPHQSSNALWAARRGGAKHVVRLSA